MSDAAAIVLDLEPCVLCNALSTKYHGWYAAPELEPQRQVCDRCGERIELRLTRARDRHTWRYTIRDGALKRSRTRGVALGELVLSLATAGTRGQR